MFAQSSESIFEALAAAKCDIMCVMKKVSSLSYSCVESINDDIVSMHIKRENALASSKYISKMRF